MVTCPLPQAFLSLDKDWLSKKQNTKKKQQNKSFVTLKHLQVYAARYWRFESHILCPIFRAAPDFSMALIKILFKSLAA